MANSYEASIHLLLKDGVSGALARIGADVLGLHGKFDKLSHKIAEVGKGLAMIGSAAIFGKMIKDITEANAQLEKQINLFKIMGNSQRDADALRSRAYDTSVIVRGTGVADNAKAGRELASVLNNNPAAMKLLPDFQRTGELLKYFGVGSGNDRQMQTLAKMIELRGGAFDKDDKIDPVAFKREMDAAYKALIVGGGLISENDLLGAVKQGGPAFKGFRGDPDGFWKSYLAMIEDMGGQKAGTSATAAFRSLIGGNGLHKSYKEMQRVGMLTNEGWKWDKDHKGITITDPSKALRGYDTLLHQGLRAWVGSFLKQELEGAGIKGVDAQNAELYRMGLIETMKRGMGLFLTNEGQAAGIESRYDKVLPPDQAQKIMNQDFTHNLDSIGISIHNFASAIGNASSVAPILGHMADAFNKLAKIASENPGIANAVTWGGGIFGTLTALGGAMRIGGAFANGFGLTTAATALDGSAAALTAAAVRLGGAGVAAAAEGVLGGAGAASGASRLGFLARLGGMGRLGAGLMGVGGIAGATIGTLLAAIGWQNSHPEDFVRNTGYRHPPSASHHSQLYGPFRQRVGWGRSAYWDMGPWQDAPHSAMFGPFREWHDAMPSARGRAASPAHWDLPSADKVSGETGQLIQHMRLPETIMKGFKSADFSAGGKKGGSDTISGFLSANFAAAGQAAGAKVAAAIAAAVGSSPMGSGVKTAGAQTKSTHVAVMLDRKVIARAVTKEQTKMAMMPHMIGGHDSYGSYLGPGTTEMPA